jgi:hypothetical protein
VEQGAIEMVTLLLESGGRVPGSAEGARALALALARTRGDVQELQRLFRAKGMELEPASE